MQSEIIGDYEIEYSAVHLPNSEAWGAWLTVYGPSPNPMHRNPVFPSQRVSPETSFGDEREAEQEAKKIAYALIEGCTKKN